MTEKTVKYQELSITHADVYDAMGYQNATPDKEVQREVQAILNDVQHWLHPRFCFFVCQAMPDFDMGRIILHQLKGSEAYALFIATAGIEYESYLQRLKNEGDMVRVYIADALGSVIAEKTADMLETCLQESINKLGWHHTNRFSPGYCGWHVSQQQQLFPLFQGHTCGVRLTDSSLMLPIKSVSGIIGLGKEVRRLDYTCGLCNFEKCYKRKRK